MSTPSGEPRSGPAPTRAQPVRARLRGPARADSLRITRTVAHRATVGVLVLACLLGAARAADEFLSSPSWSCAGRSAYDGAVATAPWLAEAGLILALVLRRRGAGLALAVLVVAVLAAEPMEQWASFGELPGFRSRGGQVYAFYFATVLMTFPVYHRPAPRHRRSVAQ
ncbi:MAG TPA: hypothetical protein VGX23_13590 [Actinocrinis sp.]|nr:hypothetical protein [Actinocrinis sp.]